MKKQFKPYLYTTAVLSTLLVAGGLQATANADTTAATSTTTDAAQAATTTQTTNDDAAASSASASSQSASEASAASASAIQSAASSASSANFTVSAYDSANASVNSNAISATSYYTSLAPDVVNPTWNQNFHFNTANGYSNDIQSIVPHSASDGSISYYDIYYLSEPLARRFGTQLNWNHMVTKDFKTFYDFDQSNRYSINNVAIPDPQYLDLHANSYLVSDTTKELVPWSSAASGSIIDNNGLLTKDAKGNSIDADAKLAYLTNLGNNQSIYLAYSNNGGQFQPYSDTAIINPQLVAGLQSQYDFRDPFVMRTSNNQLVAYIAGGTANKIFTFTSSNGINWNYQPDTNIDLSDYSIAEMPVVKTVNGQPVLFFIAGSQNHYDNQSGDYALTGSFNSAGTFVKDANSKVIKLDNGFDNFAANYTNLSANQLVSVGWVGNWNYSPMGVLYQNNNHFGTYTLARTVSYQNGQFVVDPIEPDSKTIGSYNVSAAHQFNVATNNKVSVQFSGKQTLSLTRQDGTNNNVSLSVDGTKVTLSRNWDMNTYMNKSTTIDVGKAITKAVFYVDNSSIEVYLPEVHQMMTLMTLSGKQNSPYQLSVTANAKVVNASFNLNYVMTAADDENAQNSDKNGNGTGTNDGNKDNGDGAVTSAQKQAQTRIKTTQKQTLARWQSKLTAKQLQRYQQLVQKQFKLVKKELAVTKTTKQVGKVETSFNCWLATVAANIKATIDRNSHVTIKKATRYYSRVGSKTYHKTTKKLTHVKIKRTVRHAGHTWYQVKINGKLVYIQK